MNAQVTPLQRRLIKVEPATPESVAAFGTLLGNYPGVKIVQVEYYGAAVVLSRPIDYQCATDTELSLTTINRRPFNVRYMERHFQHTQTFIPLGGKPFVAVFAPPCDGELPDPDKVRAFRFDGSMGFCLHLGTWHEFPFAIEDGTQVVVALSSQTGEDLHHRADNGIEAFGPDLDKKDMTMRLHTVFELQL